MLFRNRPRYYVPKHPFSTAPWYPQQPLTALEQPALYSKYDVDTLFYIFYYQVGSYQQCVFPFLRRYFVPFS